MYDMKELLRKHDYIVTVKVDGNVIDVKYNDIISVQYVIDEKEDACIISCYYDEVGESVCTFRFISRWYILLDIFRLCRKHNLPYVIIDYVDHNNNPGGTFADLVKINLDDNELKLEKELEHYIVEILQDKKKINDFDDVFIKAHMFVTWKILKGLLV